MNWTTAIRKHKHHLSPLPGIAAVVALLFMLSACQQPQPRPLAPYVPPAPNPITSTTAVRPPSSVISKVALSGKAQVVQSYMSLNADCSSSGKSVVRIVEAPTHGNITIADDVAYPWFEKENQRYVCNTKQVPATNVTYQSDPGFIGTDTMKLDVFFPNATFRTDVISVSVK